MGHKRHHSIDTENRIPSKMQKIEKVWDPYCWLCHQECHRDGTDLRCSTCNLSYHQSCYGYDDYQPKQFKCDLCDRMRNARDSYTKRCINKNDFNKTLSYVVERILTVSKFSRFKSFNDRKPAKGGPLVLSPYNLDIVHEKVDDKQYETSVEFLKDIRQIRHNAEIVISAGTKGVVIAREMEQYCEKEMYDFEMCSQCFRRSNRSEQWFTELCSPPHILVWAKFTNYPWWPAKVIGTTSAANNILDVRFFGSHEMAKVNAHDCYIYPSKNPNRSLSEKIEEEIKDCAMEAEKYLKNIEIKYSNKVKTATHRIPLEVRKIGKQLMDLIPNLKLSEDYKLPRKPVYLQRAHVRKNRAKSSTSPVKPSSPPQSSLTPPPSPPPLPLPTADSLPPFLPANIKHSVSDADIHRMTQFTLKIEKCDAMPAIQQRNSEHSFTIDEDDELNNQIDENHIETMIVDSVDAVVPDDILQEAHDQCDVSEESFEQINCYEIPSPPFESLLRQEPLENQHTDATQRYNELESKLASVVAENAKMQEENEQLKKRLAEYERLQQHHGIEVQEAIDATKHKEWCVNCMAEAHIPTKYSVPVCSQECLLFVWQERMERAQDAEISGYYN